MDFQGTRARTEYGPPIFWMKIWSHRWDLSNSHLIKKTIYNFWTDYEKLSPEQKWLFDDANESWAKFKATDEEYRELEKLHPNWKLPDDLEDEPVNYELVDIEEFSDEGI